MSVDLLQDLRDDGRVDSTGHFTLDATKAREKMKQYQLTDPHHYVLQVLQSAVASGATTIEVKTDADDCWVRHDGRPPSPQETGNLFGSLFASDRDADVRALRELAIGINAATALNPSSLRLECWDGAAGAVLEIRGAQEAVQPLATCPWPEGGRGLRLHVRQRHSWRTLKHFFTGLPEAGAVRAKCCWSPVPITLDGRPVVVPPEFGENLGVHDVEGLGYRARLAIPVAPADSARLDIVLNGVRMRHLELKGAPFGVRGVVWATDLAKNVSQSDIVEDGAWKGLLSSLRAHMRDLLIAAAEGGRPEFAPHLLWALGRFDKNADSEWRRWKGVKKSLLDVPLLPGVGGRRLALRPLLEQHDLLKHLPVTKDAAFPDLPDAPLVVLVEPKLEDTLRTLFPRRQDYTQQLKEVQRSAERRAAWEAEPQREPSFAIGSFLARVPLKGDLRGEVALPAELPRKDPPLALFKSSRPLATVPFRPATVEERAVLWPGVAAAVNHDGLLPDRTWEGVIENEALEAVRVAVEAALPDLFAALSADFPAGDDERHFATRACLSWLEYLAEGGATYTSPEGLPAAVAGLPLFTRLDGAKVTLTDLAREVEEQGDVAFLEPGAPAPDFCPPRLVLRPGRWERNALERYFGTVRLRNYAFDLQREAQKARFMALPQQEARVTEAVVARVPLEGADVEGEVALLGGPTHPSGIWVMFLHQGRPLGGTQMDTVPGPYVAVAQSAGLNPSPDFRNVIADAARERVLKAVHEAARRLPLELARRLPELDEAQREVIVGVLWRHLDWESGTSCDGFMGRLDGTRKALKKLAVFPSVDGAWRSLDDLLEYTHEHGKVGYLTTEPPCSPDPGEVVLHTRSDRVPLLRGILGTWRLFDAQPGLMERARRREIEGQPALERLAVPEGPWIAVAPLPGGGGEVALAPDPTTASRLLLYRRGRFLGERTLPLEVAVVAAVDSEDLQPDLLQDAAFSAVVGSVQAAARALAAETLKARGRELAEWTLRLAGQLEKDGDLVRVVKEIPVLEDADGQPLRLADLPTERLRFLPAGHSSDPALARQIAGGRVPVLTPEQQGLLGRLVQPLEDLTPAVATETMARRNKARERRTDFALPDGDWLARAPAGEGLQGEIGLPCQPGGGVTVYVDGLEMGTVNLHPGLGFAGMVNGPFAVTPTWDGLADVPEVRKRLAPATRRVMGELARAFPGVDAPSFPRARQAVLAWTDWRRTLELPRTGVEAALAELPLFPLAGGRHADLATLGETVRRSGRLLRCRPGEEAPATGEAIWVTEPGSVEEAFLARFAAHGVLDWKVVLTNVVPEEEAPPPPSPEEALLEALRAEIRILRESGHPELSERMLEELRLGRPPEGTLWSCDPGGRSPTLNREHPVVREILAGGPVPAERLYFLLSSLYSVLNRACAEIRDEHERGFHRRVLETLLGPMRDPPTTPTG